MKKFLSVLMIVAIFCGSTGFSVFADSMFKDVPKGAYYESAVEWAYENGITTGTSESTFSPSETCVRAQVVTFLWRANGSPEPKNAKNPFKDIKKGNYYYKAVLWAVEKGITTGTSATTFSPNAACTRGQVVTFLWRAKAEPSAAATNVFKDVKKGSYYYNAVLWAVENEITNGISAKTFAPDASCTRGQIVTFLYRDLYKAPETHRHTYVKYKCSQCGAVDKAHAYEYLEEWVKENGEIDGDRVEVLATNGDKLGGLAYSADGDYLYIFIFYYEGEVPVYSSIFLDDFFYGATIGNIDIFGHLEAKEFTENDPITYEEYNGPIELKWEMIEFAQGSMCELLDFLDWLLDEVNLGITLADLGFYAY